MPLSFFKMALVNFDWKPSARVLSRLLVVRDFNHSFIWRRMGPGWSSDGGQALKTLLTFVDIYIASSRVMGIILSVSRRRFVATESEDIYPWPDMSVSEISLSRRIIWLMGNSRTSTTMWFESSRWMATSWLSVSKMSSLNVNEIISHASRWFICVTLCLLHQVSNSNTSLWHQVLMVGVSDANGFVTIVEYWYGWCW